MQIFLSTDTHGSGTGSSALGARAEGLEAWGWNARLQAAAAQSRASVAETGDVARAAALLPARILEARRGSWRCLMPGADGVPGEQDAVLAGRFMHGADAPSSLPATGDWVLASPSEDSGPAVIRALLPRSSAFSRKAPGDVDHDRIEEQVLVANIDTAFIVCAAGHDWNPRRIERFLTLAWESGARPVVVISKLDLSENPDALLAEAEAISIGVPSFGICAPEGYGMERFADFLAPGATAVLLGSSGAGKSTIVNALAGKELQKVTAVRQDDQRGRHTTTSRTLLRLDSGALLVDTPGMRELQLWAEEDALATAFQDIEALAESCRFRDCGHGAEPGCAVRAALESGELDPDRHRGWLKLKRELHHLARREDPAIARAERARWKAINKSMRDFSQATKGLR